MPFYKDTPENRKLNRVGKFYGPKGPSPIKSKYTKPQTPKFVINTGGKGNKKFQLPKDPEKLKQLQIEAKKLKSLTVAKPGQLKNLQAEAKNLKSMMDTGRAAAPKKAPAPKVKKKAKKQNPNILRVIDIELMMEYFKSK